MRLSLVISIWPWSFLERGTLKSTRMKTRLPVRSRSRIERKDIEVLFGIPRVTCGSGPGESRRCGTKPIWIRAVGWAGA